MKLGEIKILAAPTLYHASVYDFNKFKQQYKGGYGASDLGFHFGNEKTVTHYKDHVLKSNNKPIYVYTVKLNIKKSVRLKEDRLGSWSANKIVKDIFESTKPIKGITEEMVDMFYDDEIRFKDGEEWWGTEWGNEEQKIKNVIRWLGELGYDSITYKNTYEGGGISYIVFDPSKIKILNKEKFE